MFSFPIIIIIVIHPEVQTQPEEGLGELRTSGTNNLSQLRSVFLFQPVRPMQEARGEGEGEAEGQEVSLDFESFLHSDGTLYSCFNHYGNRVYVDEAQVGVAQQQSPLLSVTQFGPNFCFPGPEPAAVPSRVVQPRPLPHCRQPGGCGHRHTAANHSSPVPSSSVLSLCLSLRVVASSRPQPLASHWPARTIATAASTSRAEAPWSPTCSR